MKYSIPIEFSISDVRRFAEITGDRGDIHVKHGVVQGGYIISCLPKWLEQTKLSNISMNIIPSYDVVSMAMTDVKFRKPLHVDMPATITFEVIKGGVNINKLSWSIAVDSTEHCCGDWILHRAPDMSKIV